MTRKEKNVLQSLQFVRGGTTFIMAANHIKKVVPKKRPPSVPILVPLIAPFADTGRGPRPIIYSIKHPILRPSLMCKTEGAKSSAISGTHIVRIFIFYLE